MDNRKNIDKYKNIFKEKLKELRQERRFSQRTIAEALDIAVSTYANWEQGRTEPSIYDIYRLIEIYGIEANELFDISEL
ncbi:MAG: helix-turn-helix transcriptional regulator [Clostridiales bacterium]|nr:helix-turn-helix transcriptional regulator [Clostridiales bacterium]